MNNLSREVFNELLKTQRVKTRLQRELRFVPEDIAWEDYDLLPVGTRSGAEGILLIKTNSLYLIPYELTTGLADKATGRSKPITCDFCFTWQQGSNAAQITFERPTDKHKFTYLCCADLRCSLHVRSLTAEAALSRSQLREDLTPKQRISRLQSKLETLTHTLQISTASDL